MIELTHMPALVVVAPLMAAALCALIAAREQATEGNGCPEQHLLARDPLDGTRSLEVGHGKTPVRARSCANIRW